MCSCQICIVTNFFIAVWIVDLESPSSSSCCLSGVSDTCDGSFNVLCSTSPSASTSSFGPHTDCGATQEDGDGCLSCAAMSVDGFVCNVAERGSSQVDVMGRSSSSTQCFSAPRKIPTGGYLPNTTR